MSGYGKVDTSSEPAATNCCEIIQDLIYGVSEEEKLRRKFYRKQLLLLRAGGMFKLVYVGKSRSGSTLAAATNYASSVLGMFSGSGSSSGDSQSKEIDSSSKAKTGEGIWVSIVNDDTTLEWKTLANEENQPKAMQHIQLYKISRASKSHCNDNAPEAETRRLIFEDKNGDRILEIEADSIVERDLWVESFDAAFHFLSSDIKSSEKSANRTLRMERRWQDIQERDRARQERKNKLTNNGRLGLKYTSEAMARRE